jgi:hypothetical protein
MASRTSSQSIFLRILICVLTLVVLIPPCTAQFSTSHSQMAGMNCCPTTSTIQPPQFCCALHPQPAEQSAATPQIIIPPSNTCVLPQRVAIPSTPTYRIPIAASPPPLLHPILRI